MSLFWEYFRETLRFPLIWAAGALAQLAKGGAAALDAAREHIIWLRSQFLPATAHAEFLARFAKSRGIKRHPTETDAQFKSRVIYAFSWQLLGGKAAGLPKILDFYGFPNAEITNVRDEDPARWAEFKVGLEAPEILSEENWATALWAINDYKPARSKLAQLRFSRQVQGAVSLAAGVISGEITAIYPWAVSEVSVSSPVYAAAAHGPGLEIITIYPKETP